MLAKQSINTITYMSFIYFNNIYSHLIYKTANTGLLTHNYMTYITIQLHDLVKVQVRYLLTYSRPTKLTYNTATLLMFFYKENEKKKKLNKTETTRKQVLALHIPPCIHAPPQPRQNVSLHLL